jgi:hypothetical protein
MMGGFARAGLRRAILGIGLVAMVLSAAPAAAMVNGTPDDGAHPAVGMMGTRWGPNSSGWAENEFRMACSGTLISPTVYLTAAHCVAATDRRDPSGVIHLWFGDTRWPSDGVSTPGMVTGRGIIHPDYRPDYRNDIAVVLLDEPVELDASAYGRLPAENLLGAMKKDGTLRDARFTLVGYGISEMINGDGRPFHWWANERTWGVVTFSALDKLLIHQAQRINQGGQGACNGDSGGPSFLWQDGQETSIVVGVTSSGDIPCYATNTASRTDTPQALAFIRSFLGPA